MSPSRSAVRPAQAEEAETYQFGPVMVRIRQHPSVWRLTPHGQTLGEAMAAEPAILKDASAIEIGAGTGVHAIAALKLGARRLDVTDIEPAALRMCRENAFLNGVDLGRCLWRDWLSFTSPQPYDLLICNPPFCKAGTADRRHFIRRLIFDSPRFLHRDGRLLFVQSSMADFSATESELKQAGYGFSCRLERRYPFRSYYFDEPGFLEQARRVPGGFEVVEGNYIETLRVYLCTCS